MALVTLCDNCENDWLVDQLVFVEAVDKNLCPVCINNLVEMLWSEFTGLQQKVIIDMLEKME